MDQSSFDRIARLLGGATTRRAGIGAALGGLLGRAALDAADAKKGGTGKGDGSGGANRRRDRGKPAAEGPCGDGSRKANTCTSSSDCCTGICNMKPGRKNRDGKGRCRCIQRGKPCTADRNCCGGRSCANGVCDNGSGPTPPPPPPPPDPCAAATVCTSGCPHTTIQGAIIAAAAGDTIAILGGSYTEELTIDKNLTLVGCPTATVIDTGANARTITITNGAIVELRNLVVDGTGTSSSTGGGISCDGQLTLSGAASVTNGANFTNGWGKGGCVYLTGTSSLSMNDTSSIHDCWADAGAGVSSDSDATPVTMTGTAKISDCSANYIGGGLWILGGPVSMSGSSEISGCGTNQGSGAGVYLASATMTMSGSSAIRNNTCNAFGGGVYLYDETNDMSSLTLTESATVTGNTANQTYGGGGVYANITGHTLTAPAGSIINNTPDNCSGGSISC